MSAPQPRAAGHHHQRPAGLIVDYGGVLTTSVRDTIAAWARAEAIDAEAVHEVAKRAFGGAYGAGDADHQVHRLERGEIDTAGVEQALAGGLRDATGRPLAAAGLVGRLFAGLRPEPAMVRAVGRLRADGVATALLSNSWGAGVDYDRTGWPELFDVVVISGEVGMRKPEERIYRLTAQRLGLPPQACVFVDDHPANVAGAVAVGMVGVHHTDPDMTLGELATLFAVPLVGPSR